MEARRTKAVCSMCTSRLPRSYGANLLVVTIAHTCTGCKKVLCTACKANKDAHGTCLAVSAAMDAARVMGAGLAASGSSFAKL